MKRLLLLALKVLVAQCVQAVGVYATMKDGTLLAFDMSSGVPFDDQIAWAEQARRSITIETKCSIEPGAVGKPAPADVPVNTL